MAILQPPQNRFRLWQRLGALVALSLLFTLTLTQCQAPEPSQRTLATLQRVVSGDTLEVSGLGEQPALIQTVRLIGIDAPDLVQQPWGEAARTYLQESLARPKDPAAARQIDLEYDLQTSDRFGRQLAYVWSGTTLLNQDLVAQGHALATPYFPNVRYETDLQAAQEAARLIGRGIWDPTLPLRETPAEFRAQNRN
ncbi:MAG: thermonuclease family protein [Cyanobacteria bacterium P01_H01_bin.121]